MDTSWWYQVGIRKYWKDLLPGSQEIFTLGRYQVSTKDTGWDLSPQGSTEFVSAGHWGYVHCW